MRKPKYTVLGTPSIINIKLNSFILHKKPMTYIYLKVYRRQELRENQI